MVFSPELIALLRNVTPIRFAQHRPLTLQHGRAVFDKINCNSCMIIANGPIQRAVRGRVT
jgi:hypothetical protein